MQLLDVGEEENFCIFCEQPKSFCVHHSADLVLNQFYHIFEKISFSHQYLCLIFRLFSRWKIHVNGNVDTHNLCITFISAFCAYPKRAAVSHVVAFTWAIVQSCSAVSLPNCTVDGWRMLTASSWHCFVSRGGGQSCHTIILYFGSLNFWFFKCW